MEVFMILLIPILAIILMAFIKGIGNFLSECAYLVGKINRSTSDREEEHWKKKLYEFYLSKIPVIGDRLRYRPKR